MKRIFIAPLVALMLLGATAFADDPKPAAPAAAAEAPKPDAPVDPEEVIDDAIEDIDKDPGKQVSWMIQLAKSGRWGPFAGAALLFIVWGLRKFIWKLISPKVLPWLTLGLAVVVSVAVGLLAGNIWWQVIIDVFTTGGVAAILWSTIFKHFMKPKEA